MMYLAASKRATARVVIAAVILASFALLIGLAAVAPRQAAATFQPAETFSSATQRRLEMLDGRDAQAYLHLAEELADANTSLAEMRLARHLYVLALCIDANTVSGLQGQIAPSSRAPAAGSQSSAGQSSVGQGRIAASACFGLAELTRSRTDRQWLTAIADAYSPRQSVVQGLALTETPESTATAIALFDTISLARSGEGRRAGQLLARPGVEALLSKYQRALDDRGYVAAAGRLRRYITDWPICPECSNRRTVSRSDGPRGQSRFCSTCGGNPGPLVTVDELINQSTFQASLLSGISDSWTAAMLVDGSGPSREPTAADVARLYNIDPDFTVYRNGQWIAQNTR